jgi:hypothetical protein
MVQENNLFYLYDNIAEREAINLKEHRTRLANVAKRSRYCVVNPGVIDQPKKGVIRLRSTW